LYAGGRAGPIAAYWSDTGRVWTRVSDLPPGITVDAVVTPTQVLVFMLTTDRATVTVWSVSLR